jgi:serine O-acetyltransferase
MQNALLHLATPVKQGTDLEDDAVWSRLVAEVRESCDRDHLLASFYSAILEAPSLELALVRRLASQLANSFLPTQALTTILREPVFHDETIGIAIRADLAAVLERDPATTRLLEPFLFYKGFAAIQTHRLAHYFWTIGKRDIALYLQSRSSEVLQTDIHPAAQFGKGILLDHATGFVAGETAVVEDEVSILHGVTLGGTGSGTGQRHPKVRTGVLIGAGAQILGDVEIGAYSKVAAGSFVTQSVPPRCTAVGVPARIIEGAGSSNPAQSMDQKIAEGTYESFTYVI